LDAFDEKKTKGKTLPLLFGSPIKISSPANPTDFQWENLQQTKTRFYVKLFASIFFMFIGFLIFSSGVGVLKNNQQSVSNFLPS